MDTISIVLADDHTLLREALREILHTEEKLSIIAEASDGESAIECVTRLTPDVLLLDVGMPDHVPVETARRVLAASPRTSIIVLTMYDDPSLVKEMLNVGVSGYLHKDIGRRDLVAAIHRAAHLPRQITMSVSRESIVSMDSPGGNPLSAREQEVLALVAEALSNRQIASRMSITEGTVKRHLRNIFDKLGAESRLDAVNKSQAHGHHRFPRPR
ncbi:Transcriptional regulatory protein LnrK [Nocardiopsis dassonvillei]|uniref:response regulator n=1 Tax=Nocardiopsis dassonvillei TaxID=2014 RepID=UPI003F57213E